ncbi:hypothetical protein [Mobilicoccus massiliensis]|uniref:hypothetical protein n=1 Tax=Mobilicoccus massiliensis TaxID=1522310 RepID=UPI00058B18FF|nr:hypothetical protein [Mobilicoccus massiliensis]
MTEHESYRDDLDVTLSIDDKLAMQLDGATRDEVLRELAMTSFEQVDIETRATLSILLGLDGIEHAADVADRLGVSTVALLDAIARAGLKNAIRLSRNGRTLNIHLAR